MAKEQIISKAISAGDPVTAEIFNNLVLDLNNLATPIVTSNIVIDNALGVANKQTLTEVVWNSGLIPVKVLANGAITKVPVDFAPQKWNDIPTVWVQVYTEGLGTVPWSKSQIFTQVNLVSKTKVNIHLRSNTAADIKIIVFATGKSAA